MLSNQKSAVIAMLDQFDELAKKSVSHALKYLQETAKHLHETGEFRKCADDPKAEPRVLEAYGYFLDKAGYFLGASKDSKEENAAYKEAVKWYERAVLAGSVDAINNLAVCYKEGKGVKADLATYEQLMLKADRKGCLGACQNLGRHYVEQGQHQKAIPLLQRGVRSGDPELWKLLGDCYAEGNGITPDSFEAAKCYVKAVELATQSDVMDLTNDAGAARAAILKLWERIKDKPLVTKTAIKNLIEPFLRSETRPVTYLFQLKLPEPKS